MPRFRTAALMALLLTLAVPYQHVAIMPMPVVEAPRVASTQWYPVNPGWR